MIEIMFKCRNCKHQNPYIEPENKIFIDVDNQENGFILYVTCEYCGQEHSITFGNIESCEIIGVKKFVLEDI